jgi:hypothetical protein
VAKLDTLKVSFAALDPALFTYAANCSTSAGQLHLSLSSTYRGATSVDRWDLTGSHLHIKVVQASNATAGANNPDTQVGLSVDANNQVYWVKEGTLLYAQRVVGGVTTTVTQFTYNAATHLWWGISESGGTVTWWTSTDGLTWTSRGTWVASGLALTSLQVELITGFWGTTTAATDAIFDNLNLDGTEIRLELAPYLVGAGGTKHFIGGGVGLRSYVVAPTYVAAWNDAEPWTDSDPWIE